MANILIVEDQQEINDMLYQYLSNHNFTCEQAFSGSEAKLLLSQADYDLILLDLMLPKISGETLLQEIKQNYKSHVIILSAKDEIEQRVSLLEAGADDYICKPFALPEVLARIHVQLRRSSKTDPCQTELVFKDLHLNATTHEVFMNGNALSLTKREFLILQLLMESPNRVFTKEAIYEQVWQEPYLQDERIINTHIGNLRAKLRMYSEEEYIKTIWGIGFKLANPENL